MSNDFFSQLDSGSNREYYADDITAVPFRLMFKCLRCSAPLPFALGFAAFFRFKRLLRSPLSPNYAGGPPGSGRLVEAAGLPSGAIKLWTPIVEELGQFGFRPLSYRISDTIGAKTQAAALLMDADRTTLALLEWLRMPGANGPTEEAPYELTSYFDNDPEVSTFAANKDHLHILPAIVPDFVEAVAYSNEMSATEIYTKHCERIKSRRPLMFTPEAAIEEAGKRTRRRFDAVIKKGLVRKLSPTEVAAVRKHKPA